MRIAYIGTYPPRGCGIGTFTNNLVKSIVVNTDNKNVEDAIVIALNKDNEEYDYPKEVKLTIRESHQRDYINAANFINYSDIDICILEHEFGIFGGDEGLYILPFIHHLKIPLIVTFHTVLKEPNYTQKAIVQSIGKESANIVVMSKKAVNFLENIYQIPSEKISYIEHGVPNFDRIQKLEVKKKFNLKDKKILFTFGLLSRNKGIETVIKALPEIKKQVPNVLYIVMGKTHPEVMKHSGEEYRNYLYYLAKKNGVEDNLYFINKFTTEEMIYEYLSASDVYVTPYLNEAQITSGTLAYAVGAGAVVVSTPYWHATELLADGRGFLFDFSNEKDLATQVCKLLSSNQLLEETSTKAYDYGKKIRWPKIGKQYLTLCEYIKSRSIIPEQKESLTNPDSLPKFNLAHVLALTDSTGIIQHAKYTIPNRYEGYCLDDNARGLILATLAHRLKKDTNSDKLLKRYLAYIFHAQREDGYFRNFMSYKRDFLDDIGSEDSFGRTVWGLGYLIRHAPNNTFRQLGREIFGKSYQNFEKIKYIRSLANVIIGLSYYLQVHGGDEPAIALLRKLSDRLTDSYEKHKTDKWQWFDNELTYDNALLPLAMFHTYNITGQEKYYDIAIETTHFLTEICFRNGFCSLVGNDGWFKKDDEKIPEFDQQPVDAMALVLLYYQAYKITKDKKYLDLLSKSYMWFQGENHLRIPLFDHESNGCCDGLEKTGINRNQGAESTLAYWVSHLTLLSSYEKEFIY
jgi:glycosyltransferase involved in cell wall biosynthesis